jgi:DNA polymerase III delta prime subunit
MKQTFIMENIDLNDLLDRNELFEKLRSILIHYNENKYDLTCKRGIYIYGDPGSGKTSFVNQLLKSLDYDIITYDAGDIRNKSIIETITKQNMSDRNILSMFHKKVQNIAIVMDEIDGMNSGDKGGINALIKLIRPKKTKKQKLEDVTLNPIICIGNYHVDKKIQELMKVCHVFELKIPTRPQVDKVLDKLFVDTEREILDNIIDYAQGDLRKIISAHKLFINNSNGVNNNILKRIFVKTTFNEDAKIITKRLINTKYDINNHLELMNETDRTIVGLLWHENIVDMLSKNPLDVSIDVYRKMLDNMCFADYMDRITFQKQIWQFNEMTSLIKTFYNNKIYLESSLKHPKFNPAEVRFTKVLTKYSTEFNNNTFIQSLCQELSMDVKDLLSFFVNLRDNNNGEPSEEYLSNLFENLEISKLDINRIYRYIDKCNNYALSNDVVIETE